MSTIEERFWAKVQKTETCWLWTAYANPYGYGKIRDGSQKYAHRVSWELHNGLVPEGLCVLHKCDVPGCVNPAHLFLGTHNDNVQDKMQKGRHRCAKGEQQGHARLTERRVKAIRKLYSKGGWTQLALAKRVNVRPAAISKIISRKTWHHVP